MGWDGIECAELVRCVVLKSYSVGKTFRVDPNASTLTLTQVFKIHSNSARSN